MMPAWWIMHLIIIAYIPLLTNKSFQALLQKRNFKIANYLFWLIIAPLAIVIF